MAIRLLLQVLLAMDLFWLCQVPCYAAVERLKFESPGGYLFIEALDDDLIHFEWSTSTPNPTPDSPIYTSPMVFKKDYQGPTAFVRKPHGLVTKDMSVDVSPMTLCVSVREKTRGGRLLSTMCPVRLSEAWKGLSISRSATQKVYGLGQEFKRLGTADGDWISHQIRATAEYGNRMLGFLDAANGNIQIPVMYAVGPDNFNYALFLDNVYKQTWMFDSSPWQVGMFGDHIRLYVMTGPDLPDLRRDYMELVGTPPVPPRKAFGLWVSEFGYDSWDEIEALRLGLRANGFPLDGFVLDLNWFGGVVKNVPSKSNMGRLNWDTARDDSNNYFFPEPAQHIQDYAADHIALMAIEESYLANSTDTYEKMPPELSAYQRTNGRCDERQQSRPVIIEHKEFWGIGRMIDWSDPETGRWWHEQRRYPNLTEKGIAFHWTDLGEPESFDEKACYEGVERTATGIKNEHADIHNLYNLLWNRSIWQSYYDKRERPNASGRKGLRPLILSRSGAAGIQRYGVALWSGDIASNLRALATHFNAQMHMSFSGIDFFGADIGGFRREVLPFNDKNGRYRGYDQENYTQWFANGAWFDVPVRPHADNEFVRVTPPYATAPHLIGHTDSNRANIRQRYELIPYYYSLAYRAHLYGEPVVPSLAFYYQNDRNVRELGHEKLIGKDILVGVVSRYGEHERNMYLPKGTWNNYHSHEWVRSTGQTIGNVPVYREGQFRLPVFVKAGAILPKMFVDENTKDAFGHQKSGTPPHDELILEVYADPTASKFTLYEDDGETLSYDAKQRPEYRYRTTEISQKLQNKTVTVTIPPAKDARVGQRYDNAVTNRRIIIRLVVDGAKAGRVTLNGGDLVKHNSEEAFNQATSGWYNLSSNLIVAKSPELDVYTTEKKFSFTLEPFMRQTSVYFVCDNGFTQPEENIYVVGSLPALGEWDPKRAVKLQPNVYYEYISNPPKYRNSDERGEGPGAPVWSGVVHGLPSNKAFEWKCIRKRDGEEPQWQPDPNNTHRTSSQGYAGRTYGSF
jgi:alpha-glucosidase (family GH31 glycosyl hydrolase)